MADDKYLLALDCSTSCTGWAIYNLDTSKYVESGFIKPKGKEFTSDFFKRTTFMKEFVKDKLLTKYNVTHVAVEDINVVISQLGAKRLAMGVGIILSNFTSDEITFINVSTWRKHYQFRKMKSKEYKEAAVDLVEKLYDKKVSDDEADSILIGKYYIETQNKVN